MALTPTWRGKISKTGIRELLVRLWREHGLLLIIALSAFAWRMIWFHTPVVRDEGVLGYYALAWSRGYSPYTDPMFSNAPPLAILFYRVSMSLFGDYIGPLRLFNNAIFVLSIPSLASIATSWFNKRQALFASVFYATAMNTPILTAHLAIMSSLAIPFTVFAVHAATKYLLTSSRWFLLLAGLLVGIAWLVVLYASVVAVVPVALVLTKAFTSVRTQKATVRQSATRLVLDSLVLLAGAAIPAIAFQIYFLAQGTGADFFPGMLAPISLRYIQQEEVYTVVRFLTLIELLPLWLFAFLGLVVITLRGPLSWGQVAILIWALSSIPAALPRPHHGHHFAQLMPPLALLAGLAIEYGVTSRRPGQAASTGPGESHDWVAGQLLLTILAIAAVPALYFQAKQFPNSNIDLFGQRWYLTYQRNSAEQRELVSYLKGIPQDAGMMVHGWEIELYWLSGRLAPGVRWASSYRSIPDDITDKDYRKILDDLRNHRYEYVVLMGAFPQDEIMDFTRREYYKRKSIGLYEIYTLYDESGERTAFSFVSHLPEAKTFYRVDGRYRGELASLPEALYQPAVEPVSVQGDRRQAIRQHPLYPIDGKGAESVACYAAITVPPSSTLRFGVSLREEFWDKGSDGVRFSVTITSGEATQEVWSRYIDPSHKTEDRRWHDASLDLAQYAGPATTICFITEAGPELSNAHDWAYWGNPRIVTFKPSGRRE